MQNLGAPIINLDQPLTVGSALANDKLNRREFAENAARILARPDKSGFAISIEGSWGSGKSSTLAMMEELLSKSATSTIHPSVVHFNPWLIGDREDLLQSFFVEIASNMGYTDYPEIARNVTACIIDYVEAGTSLVPFGGLLQPALKHAKNAVKTPEPHSHRGLSLKKEKLEKALLDLKAPIIVFIDDIDRLSSQEVFEMIRIIKAVGDLSNIRYVCAWDPIYISRALENASIPNADTYLDKIIQVRLPIPTLSDIDKRALFDGAFSQLDREASNEYFQGGEELLESFYFRALSSIISHPRDINRIFSITSTIEPKLRGEIVLSDIIGMATIMAKTPKIFNLLKNHKEWFSGYPEDYPISKDKRNYLTEKGISQINGACQDSENPRSIENLIEYLFPLIQKGESLFPKRHIEEMKGHLAAPQRLKIALQLNVSFAEVSLAKLRNFLIFPDYRDAIKNSLTKYNCLEFLKSLEKKVDFMFRDRIHDLDNLCLNIGRLIDKEYFKSRSGLQTIYFIYPQVTAEKTISKIIKFAAPSENTSISDLIVKDPESLSLASHILTYSYFRNRPNKYEPYLEVASDRKEEIISHFSQNVLSSAKSGLLLKTAGAGNLLNQIPDINPNICPQIFKEMTISSIQTIEFIKHLLPEGWDSIGGHYYNGNTLPHVVAAYCPMEDMKSHAESQLTNTDLNFATKVALKAFVEGKILYSETGLEANKLPDSESRRKKSGRE